MSSHPTVYSQGQSSTNNRIRTNQGSRCSDSNVMPGFHRCSRQTSVDLGSHGDDPRGCSVVQNNDRMQSSSSKRPFSILPHRVGYGNISEILESNEKRLSSDNDLNHPKRYRSDSLRARWSTSTNGVSIDGEANENFFFEHLGASLGARIFQECLYQTQGTNKMLCVAQDDSFSTCALDGDEEVLIQVARSDGCWTRAMNPVEDEALVQLTRCRDAYHSTKKNARDI